MDNAYRQSVKEFNNQVSKNRYILNKIIDCVKVCGSFEIALCGQDETDASDNPGVFLGLINFVSELDAIFKEHVEKSTVFKGISKTIQNDLLDSMLAVIHKRIEAEIEQATSIEKSLMNSMDNFNEKVIDHSAHQKNRRIDLKYK